MAVFLDSDGIYNGVRRNAMAQLFSDEDPLASAEDWQTFLANVV